ncbi:MAG: hypothetical protein AAF921_06085 [Cyanobacteria bacterium P01_D01_bin.44]
MGAQNFNRLGQSTLLLLGIASIVGCPQVTSSSQRVEPSPSPSISQTAMEPASPVSSILIASETETAEVPSERDVTYTVCSEIADWQRPSEGEQAKQLQSDARYDGALQDDPLKSLVDSFWQHRVLSFATYGLSARVDPINFSGLWTVADDIWTECYSGSEGEQINAGEIAEAWLMYHRVTGLRWQDGQYVIEVEPSDAGVQVVQFERLEAEENLPILVVDAGDQPVEVFSGDW